MRLSPKDTVLVFSVSEISTVAADTVLWKVVPKLFVISRVPTPAIAPEPVITPAVPELSVRSKLAPVTAPIFNTAPVAVPPAFVVSRVVLASNVTAPRSI